MKQLYHTSCETGRSVTGNSGFQVRACTGGKRDQEIIELEKLAGYQLENWHSAEPVSECPIRLAFVKDGSGRSMVLVHSVYVGKDPETGRNGNYFTHMLYDLPVGVTAEQVISTYRSSDWQTADEEKIQAKLGPIEELPRGDWISPGRLRESLQHDAILSMVQFLIDAWLERKEKSRIFLAAPPDHVALAVFALTECLPRSVTSELTFSTYEKEALKSSPLVVGVAVEPGKTKLPQNWTTGGNKFYNAFDRTTKTYSSQQSYTNWVVRQYADYKIDAVKAFNTLADQIGCSAPDIFALHGLVIDGRLAGLSNCGEGMIQRIFEAIEEHDWILKGITNAAESNLQLLQQLGSTIVKLRLSGGHLYNAILKHATCSLKQANHGNLRICMELVKILEKKQQNEFFENIIEEFNENPVISRDGFDLLLSCASDLGAGDPLLVEKLFRRTRLADISSILELKLNEATKFSFLSSVINQDNRDLSVAGKWFARHPAKLLKFLTSSKTPASAECVDHLIFQSIKSNGSHWFRQLLDCSDKNVITRSLHLLLDSGEVYDVLSEYDLSVFARHFDGQLAKEYFNLIRRDWTLPRILKEKQLIRFVRAITDFLQQREKNLGICLSALSQGSDRCWSPQDLTWQHLNVPSADDRDLLLRLCAERFVQAGDFRQLTEDSLGKWSEKSSFFIQIVEQFESTPGVSDHEIKKIRQLLQNQRRSESFEGKRRLNAIQPEVLCERLDRLLQSRGRSLYTTTAASSPKTVYPSHGKRFESGRQPGRGLDRGETVSSGERKLKSPLWFRFVGRFFSLTCVRSQPRTEDRVSLPPNSPEASRDRKETWSFVRRNFAYIFSMLLIFIVLLFAMILFGLFLDLTGGRRFR